MKIFTEHQRDVAQSLQDGASRSDWTDWKWHIRNTVRSVEDVEKVLGISFSSTEKRLYELTLKKFPMAVTPYYLSLIEAEDFRNDPTFMQAFPSAEELNIERSDMVDPLHEDADSPAPGITHRYPDRVLFHISNLCSMYCRHCTRKRKVGDKDSIPTKDVLEEGLEYIRNTPQIRDVLLSGGDPLMLSDERLDWILSKVREIEHVEVVRIGTRMPVVLPYRITDSLVEILKKHHPLWINTHFNHPRELTQSSRQALRRLADAGIPLGNQSVLLAGVNDCPRLIKKLNQKLVQNRVRPYYLYQCDLSEGLTHFRTPISKGIEIIESLRGHTSGYAVPTYVVDAPGGGGKIPVSPNYIVSWGTNKVVLRNYEGVITTYNEPASYEPSYCDRNCGTCNLKLKEEDAEERAIGIEKLLSDWDDTTCLTPENTDRMERRDDAA
ncbi:lysine 2,3-aminomutase [Desulfovibrio mangrovi]|uniref:lysine 2,3-aminomutase n=1 Tax=Desulfovibrio mangrovi TaxID=2976983 RepID=UPI0022481548|nr:lysine 2,3-aminomutase [Desulfovibrio mangrovi]UZP66797.1 lysine 2,3-aminomutase [Desulfovibrio mangrovi]